MSRSKILIIMKEEEEEVAIVHSATGNKANANQTRRAGLI
jgi:hypothetical protein